MFQNCSLLRLPTLLLILAVGLTACGGGGGGFQPGTPDPDPTPPPGGDPVGTESVEGSVQVPQGFVAAAADLHPLSPARWIAAMANLIIPQATAALEGLEPFTGGTVELIRVDDDGEQVGDVLAEATISGTGHYALTLPEGVSLSGNLVLRVALSETAQLRAVAAQAQTDIDPLSEYVLRQLVAAEVALENLPVNEVVRLRGQIEGFQVAAGSSIDEALDNLDAATGDMVAAEIAEIRAGAADDTLLDAVLGSYRLATLDLQLGLRTVQGVANREIWLFGVDGGEPVTLAAGEADGALVVTAGGVTRTAALANFPGSQVGTLDIETEIEDAFQLGGRLNSAGIISVDLPFMEEFLDDDLAIRTSARILRLRPVGGAAPYGYTGISRVSERLFGRTTDGATDLADAQGERESIGLMLLVRQGDAAPSLQDHYGLIEIDQVFGNGDCLESGHATYEISRSEDDTFLVSSDAGRLTVGCGAHEEPPAPEEITLSAQSGGGFQIGVGGEVILEGVADANGNLLLVNSAEVEGDDPVTEARTRLMVGVPLAAGDVPSLAGTTWDITSLSIEYAGGALDELLTLAGTRLTFDEGLVLAPLRETIVRRSGSGSVVVDSEFVDDETIAASYSQDGARVAIDLGDATLDGFLSADGQLLILREINRDEAGIESGVGLLVLTRRMES